MGFPILVRWYFFIKSGPRLLKRSISSGLRSKSAHSRPTFSFDIHIQYIINIKLYLSAILFADDTIIFYTIVFPLTVPLFYHWYSYSISASIHMISNASTWNHLISPQSCIKSKIYVWLDVIFKIVKGTWHGYKNTSSWISFYVA